MKATQKRQIDRLRALAAHPRTSAAEAAAAVAALERMGVALEPAPTQSPVRSCDGRMGLVTIRDLGCYYPSTRTQIGYLR